MKRTLLLIMLFFVSMPVGQGIAQDPVSAIEALDIEIWPDYDKAAVLVLLTGTLPADTRFPASVTLPVPENAQINAVARIDRTDGAMKDDIFSAPGPSGAMTFITPDPGFRVEYYLPYSADNRRRSFDYTWQAAIPVNRLQLRVQRPASAGSLNTEPPAGKVASGGDGFIYHSFPSSAVPAGQPFSLHVEYQMTTDQLSVAGLPSQSTSGQNPAPAVAAPNTGSGLNWALAALVAGGFLIIVALIWQFASRRPAPVMGKTADTGDDKQSPARFCRHCGESVDQGDRFCSACGSEL